MHHIPGLILTSSSVSLPFALLDPTVILRLTGDVSGVLPVVDFFTTCCNCLRFGLRCLDLLQILSKDVYLTAISCLVKTFSGRSVAPLPSLIGAIADLVYEVHLVFDFGVSEGRHDLASHLAWLLPVVTIPVLLHGLLVLFLKELHQEVLIVLLGRKDGRVGHGVVDCSTADAHRHQIIGTFLIGSHGGLAAYLRDESRIESA